MFRELNTDADALGIDATEFRDFVFGESVAALYYILHLSRK